MDTIVTSTSSDAYLELVQKFPLRPIRTRAVHKLGTAMLRSLIGKQGSAVRDYKAVLLSLIVEYESSASLRLDTSKVSAADVVLFLLEERGMSVSALSKVVGISQSSLSDMLNARRDWSKQAIIRLSGYFGLQPGLFLK